MNQLAFVSEGTAVYWSAIVIACAVLAVCFASLGCRSLRGKLPWDLLMFLPFGILFGFLGGRLLHFYCFYRQYTGINQALTDYSVGSFLLPGVMLGVLLAALIAWATGLIRNLPEFLDDLVPGAALGIGVGKLSAAFYSGNRGKITFDAPELQGMPWSTDMTEITGIAEYRSAVFFWEAVAAFVIFAVLLGLLLSDLLRERGHKGRMFWIFLLLWSAVEVPLDSMRYDSAFFRSNGFVSVVQILSVMTLALEASVFAIQCVKAYGHATKYTSLAMSILVCVAVMGMPEYWVQRHGDWYLSCYILMGAGAIAAIALVLFLEYRRRVSPEETEAPDPVKSSVPKPRRTSKDPVVSTDQTVFIPTPTPAVSRKTGRLPQLAGSITAKLPELAESITARLPSVAERNEQQEIRKILDGLMPTEEEHAAFLDSVKNPANNDEIDATGDWLKDLDDFLSDDGNNAE